MNNNIEITDWMRIIAGESPGEFFIEIILRTLFIYIVLMISLRLMGNRMAGQLNRIEQASLVTLAAAVGFPLQTPERGILPTVIIAFIVVTTGRLIAARASKNKKFERISLGKINILVKEGVCNMEMFKKTTLNRERVFAELRSRKIMQLGQVQRLYIEANGNFTLIKRQKEKPGLAIIPDIDSELQQLLPNADHQRSCINCGNEIKENNVCNNCGGNRSTISVSSTVFYQEETVS